MIYMIYLLKATFPQDFEYKFLQHARHTQTIEIVDNPKKGSKEKIK